MTTARHELIETAAFLPPARTLEHLGAKDAERRPAGAPHSMAEIVSHMAHWQEWFARRIEGKGDSPGGASCGRVARRLSRLLGRPAGAVLDWPRTRGPAR
jgi:hypothetical protein